MKTYSDETRHPASKPGSSPRLTVRILAILFGILLSLFILCLGEIASKQYLKRQDLESYPLFFPRNPEKDSRNQFDTRVFMSTLDPHLSHLQSQELYEKNRSKPGFIIYGSEAKESDLTIVTLGGSTTDSHFEFNWPKKLAEILVAQGLNVHVYNGGVSGYSSNQELFKLIRDVEPLDPDIVISFSGINDLGGLHYTNYYPMIHPYHVRVYKMLLNQDVAPSRLLPNLVRAGRKILIEKEQPDIGLSLGVPNSIKPASQWIRNQQIMQNISELFGIKMLTVLQPTMAIDYTPEGEEIEMLKQAVKNYEWKGDYLDTASTFYAKVRDSLPVIPNAVDFSNMYLTETGVYRDARHEGDEGTSLIAQSIARTLKDKGWLENSP